MNEENVRPLREAPEGEATTEPLTAIDAAAIFDTLTGDGHEVSWHFQPEREEFSTQKPATHEIIVHGVLRTDDLAKLLAIAEGKRCALRTESVLNRLVFS